MGNISSSTPPWSIADPEKLGEVRHKMPPLKKSSLLPTYALKEQSLFALKSTTEQKQLRIWLGECSDRQNKQTETKKLVVTDKEAEQEAEEQSGQVDDNNHDTEEDDHHHDETEDDEEEQNEEDEKHEGKKCSTSTKPVVFHPPKLSLDNGTMKEIVGQEGVFLEWPCWDQTRPRKFLATDKDRISLLRGCLAKSAFLTTMYARQTLVATYCCQLWYQLEQTSSDTKKIILLNPMRARKFRKESNKVREELKNWRRALDNARNAIRWLRKEYDLQYKLLETNFAILKMKEDSSGNMENKMEAINEEISQGLSKGVGDQMKLLRDQQDEIGNAIRELRFRPALRVAFHYLDQDFSGFIEPYDMPDLTSEEFNAMDTQNKHLISEKSLDRGIKRMKNVVDRIDRQLERQRQKMKDLSNEIEAIQQEEGKAGDLIKRDQKQVELADLEEDVKETMANREKNAKQLSEIYAKFERGFQTHADFLLPLPPIDFQKDAAVPTPLTPHRFYPKTVAEDNPVD